MTDLSAFRLSRRPCCNPARRMALMAAGRGFRAGETPERGILSAIAAEPLTYDLHHRLADLRGHAAGGAAFDALLRCCWRRFILRSSAISPKAGAAP